MFLTQVMSHVFHDLRDVFFHVFFLKSVIADRLDGLILEYTTVCLVFMPESNSQQTNEIHLKSTEL